MMPAAVDYRYPMKLKELLAEVDQQSKLPDILVAGLNLDSRNVEPGDVFIALSGTRYHGMNFAEQAFNHGAVAVLYDPEDGGQELANRLGGEVANSMIAINQIDRQLGLIAGNFFNNPSADMKVIGITGTDGKTSCSHFLAQALQTQEKCAVIGTLGWGFPGNLLPTKHTTPDAINLQQNLALLRQQGAQSVIMEVSSHAQDQGRTNSIEFNGALFTNIGRDHLDYHGSLQAYLEAKLRILSTPGLGFLVVNLDDSKTEKILQAAPKGIELLGFSKKSESTLMKRWQVNRVCAHKIIHKETGVSFQVEHKESKIGVDLPLLGDFNVDNILATLTCLIAMDFPLHKAVELLAHLKTVPGRLERFSSSPGHPSVVVDYAHTPQALEKALHSVRRHCSGKLWLVFGCGGNRDRGKRPQMGRIAERLADQVIITDDNPRNEDPQAIGQDIIEGCQGHSFQVIQNRKTAIYSAIEMAECNDLVLVAGKGHEITQEISGIKYPFSDRKVVQEALLQKFNNGPIQ